MLISLNCMHSFRNSAIIKLMTDSSVTGTGFTLNYEAITVEELTQ